ncbi:copper chaperone PCu(A)C [Streptomyces lydicus]|uniref:copper chaperone PCu(A)C n=1 Tax=Streptomyces lydicus TaxID=47763 RepID=UPI0009A1AB40|nr:copper chaperone PCu(A)C [Streptomyces lydicus]
MNHDAVNGERTDGARGDGARGEGERRDGARGDGAPTRRDGRSRLPVAAVAVPVLTCLATLGTLTLWTATGNAGTPARLSVTEGRALLLPAPGGRTEATAAFFTVRNSGGADDVLTGVTGPAGHRVMLSRTVDIGRNARRMAMVRSATVPAGGALRMTPTTLDLMLSPAPALAPGDRLTFTLHFRNSPPLTARAVATRPGPALEPPDAP